MPRCAIRLIMPAMIIGINVSGPETAEFYELVVSR
jgi:hypothetical protein